MVTKFALNLSRSKQDHNNNPDMMNSLSTKKALLLCVICIITLFCFYNAKDNQFTNWDDDYYVTNVDYIKDLSASNIGKIFRDGLIDKNPFQPNYHPLCMLSLAINYHFAQLNPTSYYLTNVALHTCNVIFVFLLFFQLCALLKMNDNGKLFVATFGALWFGIHPMHVESVCWIAERKDVLYAFFYLLGLLSYVKYTITNKMACYWATFVLFIASCLSKPMGVVFPLSLLCLDILLQRNLLVEKKLNMKLVGEKAVFFLFALIIGIAAFYTQGKTGAISDFGKLTIQERVMYAAYGYTMYVSKLFNPTYLSTFYPYPFRYTTGWLANIYYIAPFLALAIMGIPLYITYKRKDHTYFRIAAFGLGFFLANVIFVLQFISVGAALMADRYSYVAYIGLFFMLPWFVYELITRYPNLKTAALIVMTVVSLLFSKVCYDRTMVWHDAVSLLSDGIEKYPFKKDPDKQYDTKNTGIAILSYKWLGNYYFHKGEYDKAMENFDVLATIHATDQYVDAKINQINYLRSIGAPMSGGGGDNAGGVQNGGPQEPPPGAQQSNPDQHAANNPPEPGNVQQQQGMPQNAPGMPAGGMKMPMNSGAPLPPGNFQLYLDSSFLYAMRGDSLRAFRTYINAFRFNTQGVERLYADSSFKCVQAGKFDQAINQYNVIMKINTGNPYYYFYRGVALFQKGKIHNAIDDWEASLKVKTKASKDVQQSASYNLSVALDSVGNDSLALYYVEMAKNSGYTVKDDFVAKIKAKKDAKMKKK